MSGTVLCIGATLLDELYFSTASVVPHSSNPAQKTSSVGGVVRNIGSHLALLEVPVSLLTALGQDGDADFMVQQLAQMGLDSRASLRVDAPTGKYIAIHEPDGNLYVSVCDDACTPQLSATYLATQSDYLSQFEWIVIDTNLATTTIQWIIDFVRGTSIKLIIEPVSVSKASKLRQLNLDGVYLITPNEDELLQITGETKRSEKEAVDLLFERGVSHVWVRKGSQGSVYWSATACLPLEAATIEIVDSTGAGDAALAGWLYGCIQGATPLEALQWGHSLAFEVLQQKGAVLDTLNCQLLLQFKTHYYD